MIALAATVLGGNRLALARLLTLLENENPEGQEALNELFSQTGKAHLVGVTGAPGTGKSSLVNQLALYFRKPQEGIAPRRVAIVAIDPTSPFSGGALLGDRVRMRDLTGDSGVFIRSMASRGSLGGLAKATAAYTQVLDAAGFEVIFIETVGAGQDEVEIARLAHTTIVIEAPGLGDDIQAIKAGILEIADILVINKADRPGVESTERALLNLMQVNLVGHHDPLSGYTSTHLDSKEGQQTWSPPILRTVATEGTGIVELGKAIEAHLNFLKESENWQKRERARLISELETLVHAKLIARWRESISEEHYNNLLNLLTNRLISPGQAASALLNGNQSKEGQRKDR